MRPFVEVVVLAWIYELTGPCTEVLFGWRTPDGVFHEHRASSDAGFEVDEVEGMRKLIEDRVNGDPFEEQR